MGMSDIAMSGIESGIGIILTRITVREEMIAVMATDMRRRENHEEKRGERTRARSEILTSLSSMIVSVGTRGVPDHDHDRPAVGTHENTHATRDAFLSGIRCIMVDMESARRGTRTTIGAEVRREMGGEGRQEVRVGLCLLHRGYGRTIGRQSTLDGELHVLFALHQIAFCLPVSDVALLLELSSLIRVSFALSPAKS